jgi:hypothetical protein
METNKMMDFVKAMSDSDRLKIIGALSRGPQTASQLSEALGPSLREMVNHLAFLEYVGIVIAHTAEKKQNEVYELDSVFLEKLARSQFEGARPEFTPASNVEEETRRTLARFLDRDGKIRQIPNSRSQPEKFHIILNYLISAFETNRDYKESEVNSIIKRFNEDVSGLRRDLVEAGLLARERDGSRYWRLAN